MLSRVADSLYWMSRYVERAENVARFVDVNTLLSLDLPAGYVEQWTPLLSTTGDEAVFAEHYKTCLLYTSPSPRDRQKSRMPSSA